MIMELGSATAHELDDKANSRLRKEEDKISEMPDDILTLILSLLTLKEAARSSVLSHRWEKLWTFYTGCLNFDASEALSILRVNIIKGLDEPERQKYVDWVNQVLSSLDGSLPSFANVDEFRVCFDLPKDRYSCHIDKWIEFVLDKRVRSLELDFSTVESVDDPSLRYIFPLEIFSNHIKQLSGSYNIQALTSLCLTNVALSGDVIEFFLSNCPFLERLFVRGSQLLINLKVTGAKLMLKYIAILFCSNLASVEISALNLVSFHYEGPKVNLNVKNAPRLVNVFVGCLQNHDAVCVLRCLSRYFPQLETLKLRIHNGTDSTPFQPRHLYHFTKLKHLNLSLVCSSELLRWTVLIDASPVLHKLTVEVVRAQDGSKWTKRGAVRNCQHKCLREVEFVGGKYDGDLIMHLVANARKLDRLIINGSDVLDIIKPERFEEPEKKKKKKKKKQRKDAEEHAVEFKTSLP